MKNKKTIPKIGLTFNIKRKMCLKIYIKAQIIDRFLQLFFDVDHDIYRS